MLSWALRACAALSLPMFACSSDSIRTTAVGDDGSSVAKDSVYVADDTRPVAQSATLEAGRVDFQKFCAACHQPDGRGTDGGPPPLAGSPWVSGSESRLIRIVLHGIRGPLTIGGIDYNLEMPGFGSVLPDASIASVLTFVRNEFGSPSPPVTADSVAAIRAATADRAGYWTVKELVKVE